MSAVAILILFVVLSLLKLGLGSFLSVINLRHVRNQGGRVPALFAGLVDEETFARSASYTHARGRFGLLSETLTTLITIVIVVSGLLGLIGAATARLAIPASFQGILMIGAVSLLFWVVGLPFSLYSTFFIEARFGFNRTTPAVFIADTLKGLAISLVLGVPLLLALFWFMDRTGAYWWLWAFAGMTILQVVMGVLAPLVIAPLFNKFTPLPEGELREAILALAERLSFRTRGIFVVDSSKRSGHSNAYFTGLGRAKRIVLFDTLVASHSKEEVVAVLAHEIGHEKRNHVKKGIALSLALSLVGFWLLSLLLHYHPLYQAFGFERTSYAAILIILVLFAGPLFFFLSPLFSAWSRKHEFEADRFAVESVGTARGLREALLRLSKDNLSNLTPHPLYSFFTYSHPTLSERIAAIDRTEAQIAKG